MVIKVYVSRCSGNMEIKKTQEQILQLLQTLGIEFEECDVSDPTCEEDKNFMRANSDPKDGQQTPLPPQIFSDQEYLGDFDAFHEAIECDELYEFLRMAPPKTKSEAIVSLSEPVIEDLPTTTTHIQIMLAKANEESMEQMNGEHEEINGKAEVED